jgi:hypothetical protein
MYIDVTEFNKAAQKEAYLKILKFLADHPRSSKAEIARAIHPIWEHPAIGVRDPSICLMDLDNATLVRIHDGKEYSVYPDWQQRFEFMADRLNQYNQSKTHKDNLLTLTQATHHKIHTGHKTVHRHLAFGNGTSQPNPNTYPFLDLFKACQLELHPNPLINGIFNNLQYAPIATITDITLEPLLAITDAQAIAEGVYQFPGGGWKWDAGFEEFDTPREAYLNLWQEVLARIPEPQVWVVKFKMFSNNMP